MLRNNLRIALRTLLKNRAFSFITVFGLSIGMAAFLFIIHYVRFERSYEDHNANAANIYRITLDLYNGSEYVVTDCETHAPMGPMLKQRMPEVNDYVRMFHYDGLQEIKIKEEKFLEEGAYYADPSVFKIFDFHLMYGNEVKALTEPYTVVISESQAKKYYGSGDAAIGQTLRINADDYAITGIMRDSPPNTHLKFKTLISHCTLLKRNSGYREDIWNGNNEYTYLLMAPGTDLNSFNAKLTKLSAELKDKLNNARYSAQPMRDIHLYSNKTYEPEANGNARIVYFLLLIAVFIIAIAWVNYINLSTSRAMERAREVGIRKVLGSLKSQLIRQFLAESMVINVVAGAIAFALFYLLLPAFSNITGQPSTGNLLQDGNFRMMFFGIIIFGSLLSGIYPALVLSSFQPAAVLKGKFQSSSHGQILRKSLVVFQFGATVVLIICMCTVYLQVKFMRSYDLGMKINQTLVVRAPRLEVSDSVFRNFYQVYKNEVLSHPGVKTMARSGSLPGMSLHELSSTTTTRVGQQNEGGGFEFYFYGFDADFIPTMDMKIITGRNFESGKPNFNQVIINEEAVRRFGFASPEAALGERINFQTNWPGEPARIVGVVKNFYQRSPKEAHIPMIFTYTNSDSYFSIRLSSTDIKASIASVQEAWNKVYGDKTFSYFFLDEKFGQQFKSDEQFGEVMAIFSGLAVFIACLGLFGLSSYTIVQRTKEIGIRKVLGASVSQIVRLLSQDFANVVLIAALLALPVAYFAMNEWLSNYSVRIGLNVWMFILPVVAILLIALITVSIQTIKTAISNPVSSLKQE